MDRLDSYILGDTLRGNPVPETYMTPIDDVVRPIRHSVDPSAPGGDVKGYTVVSNPPRPKQQ